jgi:hypothetical protein
VYWADRFPDRGLLNFAAGCRIRLMEVVGFGSRRVRFGSVRAWHAVCLEALRYRVPAAGQSTGESQANPMAAPPRDRVVGSGTIAAILLVSGLAKAGYGVWALGAAALACLAFRAGAYVTGRIRRPASQAAAQ